MRRCKRRCENGPKKKNGNEMTAAMRASAEGQNETFVPENKVEDAFVMAKIYTEAGILCPRGYT